nr:hypothetical protein [uncultured Dyadobacter sp.]
MHFYLHFPVEPENIISSDQQFKEFLRELQNCLDRCDCERQSALIADRENVDTFQQNLAHLGEIVDYIAGYQLDELLFLMLDQSNIQYWNGNPLHDVHEEHTFYRFFSSQNRSFIDSYPLIFNELAESCKENVATYAKLHLLVDFTRSETYSPFVSLVVGRHEEQPVLINVASTNNFLSLDKWISENMPQRKYNNNDNRHCENHHDYRSDKSPLIGGVGGKAHAASLLKKAIGDWRQRDYLINWDSIHNRYIRFEFENDPQNQYHGYHLVLRGSYEEDTRAVGLIPARILSLIKYRAELEQGS